MKSVLAVILLVSIATPCQSQQFTAAKPTPLKLAKPVKPEQKIVYFVGTVALSGRFLAAWEAVNKDRQFLRVVFRPDDASAALLPQEKGGRALKELLLLYPERAVSMLLAPETAQKFIAKEIIAFEGEAEIIAFEGEASVTISDYRTGVDCDQRFYQARDCCRSRSVRTSSPLCQPGRSGVDQSAVDSPRTTRRFSRR